MDTSRYIQSCNPSRFILTSSLLVFSILFALKIDGYIKISYWLIFLPLFVWKLLVLLGAFTGFFVWCKHGEPNRFLRIPDNDCQALCIYFLMHMLIFAFEFLSCEKLENHIQIRWTLCFMPLLLCTLLSFISCLWSLKVQRSFLVQGFISANSLFFLFLPIRLDSFVTWRYIVVFVPVWISLCMALFFIIIKLILAITYRCSHRLLSNYREISTFTEVITYALLFVPLSIFSILLVDRLDHEDYDQNNKLPYTVIAAPLWVALLAWLSFSFGATDTNPWWFGLRRDICDIFLTQCPSVSLYFNNRFKLGANSSHNDLNIASTVKNIEPIDIGKLPITDINNEKRLAAQFQCTSLLEPD